MLPTLAPPIALLPVHVAHAAGACSPVRGPAEAINLAAFSQAADEAKVLLFFSPKRIRRPSPKGLTKELIDVLAALLSAGIGAFRPEF
jgi:hypothetical protein